MHYVILRLHQNMPLVNVDMMLVVESVLHMGQFLQDGENSCFVSYFFKKSSVRVTKPDKIDLILQLIMDICIL